LYGHRSEHYVVDAEMMPARLANTAATSARPKLVTPAARDWAKVAFINTPLGGTTGFIFPRDR